MNMHKALSDVLKHKILLKQQNPYLVKSDNRQRLHSIVILSKQQLNTSHKQCIRHEILASNVCKISELFFVLKLFFCLSSSMKLAPGLSGLRSTTLGCFVFGPAVI